MPQIPEIRSTAEEIAREETPAEHSLAIEVREPPSGNHFQSLGYEAAAVLAMGLVFVLGVAFELTPLNGSPRLTNWEWPWRNDLEILRSIVFLCVPFALIAYVVDKETRQEHHASAVSIRLAILAAGNLLMQWLGAAAEPNGMEQVRQIILSPSATSYYLDATRILNVTGFLGAFDRLSLGFHSSTHPPGPILFYYIFYKLFGLTSGALAGGCAVGVAASLGVVAMYAFAGLWTADRRARMSAAALYALVPALTVFFPEMDPVYPIFSMLMILFWVKSLNSTQRNPPESLWLGATIFASLFFAYNLLTIGAFLALYGLHWWKRQGWTGTAARKLLQSSGIAAVICGAAYAVLWLAAGYRPVSSFRHALAYQAVYANWLHRSYGIFALLDPYDFVLGAGILALPLALSYIYRALHDGETAGESLALTLIGFATILTVDLSGVLRGETARVWLFLQPLLIVPAALELSRYRDRWRLAIISLQWLILACIKAKMYFILP